MKKNDLLPFVLILAAFLAWPAFDRAVMVKFFPPKNRPAPIPPTQPAKTPPPPEPQLTPTSTPTPALTSTPTPTPAPPRLPEVETVLSNSLVRLVLTSHGGGVKSAEMLAYPLTGSPSSPHVILDFSERPAGAVAGYNLPTHPDLQCVSASPSTVEYQRPLPNGAIFHRRVSLGHAYTLHIDDSFQNPTPNPLSFSAALQSGWMADLPGDKNDRMPTLGFDALVGQNVEHWSAKLEKWFPAMSQAPQSVPVPGPGKNALQTDWVAVKNKYFAQILTPANDVSAETTQAFGRRDAPRQTRFLFLFPRTIVPLHSVAATLHMPTVTTPPGESTPISTSLYIGPKLYATLKANGPHQEDVLELGFFSPIGRLILRLMVWMKEKIWPYNYGLSIILLTLLIRAIFWPLNHKSMLSTRRMQEVQPLITATREKFKNDPQKQQQAMMRIYREHKINPMGGCLPMLIQIPVFFALFVVLRGAIELRFSRFLWIADLSTPENLFAHALPFPINFLPIFMGLTMWIQQKLTPASDPQQQKMMTMMPILFTVLFYNFPSGLSLYWTVNQILMIIQLALMRKKTTPPPSPAH